MRPFRWLPLGPALVLGLGCVPIATALYAQNEPQPSARVTFLDGSSITIRNPRFVYAFSSWRRRQFINATPADTDVRGLHYATRVSGRRVDRSIPLDSIRELRLEYRTLRPPLEPETTIVFQRMTATLRDGRTVVIDGQLFGADDNRLPLSLAGTSSDPALFDSLSIRGELAEGARTEGRTLLLYGPGAPANQIYTPRAERPNEVCHSCRPRGAIVQVVSF